jgi:cation:H+ antiporter
VTELLPSTDWPLWVNALAMVIAAGAIALAGWKLAELADVLADQTGLGEAVMGGLFLGGVTSLPGITASVTAAVAGRPALAVSNALGGIAAQTLFLAIADIFHRRANLEHAAASAKNLLQACLLVLLLGVVLLMMTGPERGVIGHVHVGTIVLMVMYGWGYWVIVHESEKPMWQPRQTSETVPDEPEPDEKGRSMTRLWLTFAVAAVVVFIAGVYVAQAGGAVSDQTGMSESLVGALFTAIATSLPELITTIAAVRRGALTLAVGDIVGGNAFDCLFVCAADIAYLEGSIYHAATRSETFLVSLGLFMNSALLLGLLRRQERGLANIGFEAWFMIVAYSAGMAAIGWGFT